MGGLDPGMMYSVMINVFDGSHVISNDQMVAQNITVMNDKSFKGSVNSMYIIIHLHAICCTCVLVNITGKDLSFLC